MNSFSWTTRIDWKLNTKLSLRLRKILFDKISSKNIWNYNNRLKRFHFCLVFHDKLQLAHDKLIFETLIRFFHSFPSQTLNLRFNLAFSFPSLTNLELISFILLHRWFSSLSSASHHSSFILLTRPMKKWKDVKNGATISHNKSILHSIYFLWCTFLYE